jgi:hypothetical protein
MVRTMLDEHRTPRRFWADDICTACCYIKSNLHVLDSAFDPF